MIQKSTSFKFAPAEWIPFKDRAVLDSVVWEDVKKHEGNGFENPEFELKVYPMFTTILQ